MVRVLNYAFVKLLKTKTSVFNLMSRFKRTTHIFWHETCKCKFKLDAIVCSNKKRWDKDKWRCECKELIGKDICDDAFSCNPRIWECEYGKSCDVGEYLD